VPSRQLKQFFYWALPWACCAIGVASLAQSFACPAQFPTTASLMRSAAAVTGTAKDQASKSAASEAIEAAAPSPGSFCSPACPDGCSNPGGQPGPRSVPLPWRSSVAAVAAGRPAQSHGHRSLDLRTSDGRRSAPGSPPRHRWHCARPCRGAPNGLWLSTNCWLCPAGQPARPTRPIRLLRTGDGLDPVNHLPLSAI